MGCIRWFGQAICFLLLLVLAPVAVAGLWTRATLFDSDHYVNAVAPLAGDRDVQTEITNLLMQRLDELAGNDTLSNEEYAALRPEIVDAIHAVLASNDFPGIWSTAIGQTRESLVNLLEGRELPGNGAVRVDLDPVLQAVERELSQRGIDVSAGDEPVPGDLSLTIFQSDDLARGHEIPRLFEGAVIAIAAVTVILAVLFLWASPSFWRGIFWLAAILTVSMLFIVAGLRLGRDASAGSIVDESARSAAVAIYDGVTDPLRTLAIKIGLGGLAVAALLFMARRSRAPKER